MQLQQLQPQSHCPATAIFNLEVEVSAATVTVFAVIAAVFILATVSDIVATASFTPQLQAEW